MLGGLRTIGWILLGNSVLPTIYTIGDTANELYNGCPESSVEKLTNISKNSLSNCYIGTNSNFISYASGRFSNELLYNTNKFNNYEAEILSILMINPAKGMLSGLFTNLAGAVSDSGKSLAKNAANASVELTYETLTQGKDILKKTFKTVLPKGAFPSDPVAMTVNGTATPIDELRRDVLYFTNGTIEKVDQTIVQPLKSIVADKLPSVADLGKTLPATGTMQYTALGVCVAVGLYAAYRYRESIKKTCNAALNVILPKQKPTNNAQEVVLNLVRKVDALDSSKAVSA